MTMKEAFLLFLSWLLMFGLGMLLQIGIQKRREHDYIEAQEEFEESLSQKDLIDYYRIKKLYREF
jgi:hypothetical protein